MHDETYPRKNPMHDIIIAAAFIGMILTPCVVAMFTGAAEDEANTPHPSQGTVVRTAFLRV